MQLFIVVAGLVCMFGAALQANVRLEHVKTLECDRPATALAFSPDGSCLASGHVEGHINFWNTGTWEKVPVNEHVSLARFPISLLDFSADSRYLASEARRDNDRCLELWDVESGRCVRHVFGKEESERVERDASKRHKFYARGYHSTELVGLCTLYDCNFLVLTDGTEKILTYRLLDEKWSVSSVKFSRDYEYLAATFLFESAPSSKITIWRVVDERTLNRETQTDEE